MSTLSLAVALVVAFGSGYLLRSWIEYERHVARGTHRRHEQRDLSRLDRMDGLRDDTHPGPVCRQYVVRDGLTARCGLCGAQVDLTRWE